MDELKEKWIQMLSDLAEVTSKFNELAETLNNNDYTIDGGSPFQQVIDGEFDCNGGYPGI